MDFGVLSKLHFWCCQFAFLKQLCISLNLKLPFPLLHCNKVTSYGNQWVYISCRNDPHDHCKGYSIVWTRNEAESLANLGNVADEQSQFLTFRSSIKTLFWSLFDPGHPEVIGCTEGIPRYTAMLMWYAYNIIVVTVLLNLLIAVMNAAITSVQSNSVDAWKFARTQVWLEYCNKHVILPPPANLIALIKPSLILPCRRENNAQSTPSNPDESFGYSQLINQLVNKYKSDISMRKKL